MGRIIGWDMQNFAIRGRSVWFILMRIKRFLWKLALRTDSCKDSSKLDMYIHPECLIKLGGSWCSSYPTYEIDTAMGNNFDYYDEESDVWVMGQFSKVSQLQEV